MLMIRLQLEQIDYVDNADLKLWKLISKDRNCCHCLQCRCIATACHNDIRLLSFIVTSPLPDTYTLGTMLHSLLHVQPLVAWMLGCYDRIDIVLALYTVIEAG